MERSMSFDFYNATRPWERLNSSQNIGTMTQFFLDFDPLKLKYQFRPDFRFNTSAKAASIAFEEVHSFASLNRQEYSYMTENLQLVYGTDNPDVANDIQLFHLVEKKMIHQYLAIPELCRIFDEDYFNFEWDMHVGQNFKSHTNDYYRDHFIHQIRNLYMLLILLERFNFYEATESIFQQPKAGRIPEFVENRFKAFCSNVPEGLKKVAKEVVIDSNVNVERRYVKGHQIIDSRRGEAQRAEIQEYEEEWFYRYVIYASLIMAALFHDMGYPVCHFLDVRERTSDYNPSLYMFTHNAVESFDQLAAKLRGSLLFNIVNEREIERRLQKSKKGKFDHGAYSAIAFLLQFYETGLIHAMGPEKQCAIDLAALAIYNHTNKITAVDTGEKPGLHNLFFRQNPISFMLRFVDDLQEWDRRYFEISDASDLMFCPDCGFPLQKGYPDDRPWQRDNQHPPLFSRPVTTYACGCESNKLMIRPDVFEKRRLYLVTVANWVRFTHIYGQDKLNTLNVKIGYNPYSLLVLSNMNHTYARHRLKELKGLSNLVSEQNFYLMSEGILDFDAIEIDYFMSANPVRIKLKILEDFLLNMELDKKDFKLKEEKAGQDDLLKSLVDLIDCTGKQENIVSHVLSMNKRSKKMEVLRNYLIGNNVLNFYLMLLYMQKERNSHIDDSRYVLKYKDRVKEKVEKDTSQRYVDLMGVLVDDSISSVEMKAGEWPQYIFNSSGSWIREDRLHRTIGLYTNWREEHNRYQSTISEDKRKAFIGYYQDIYFFYRLCQIEADGFKALYDKPTTSKNKHHADSDGSKKLADDSEMMPEYPPKRYRDDIPLYLRRRN